MKKYIGKKWCQLTEAQQEELLMSVTDHIDGRNGKTVKEGDCIVDFECGLSVGGIAISTEDETYLKIDDNEIIYNSEEGVIVENEKFKDLISLKDAAQMFGKEESTLRRNIKNGYFKEWKDCIKFGTTWVFDIKALEKKYNRNK
ncbi:hypothetical protein [Clostridium perfringens]|uniref:hypothetical protein n=1 Tax=Clostridium perfringens TaxID=1502 RepID=UPI00232F76B4|nr:hypothetical protein [Clostridium perfringens]MDB2050381.1 hypothetical protein [Clostridium perfringens]